MDQIKELKKKCFLPQVQKDRFSLRLKVPAGNITAQDLENVAGLAKKYGKGHVHITSRQGIEIPFIKLEDIAEIKKDLAQMGLSAGACGPNVRAITACQGAAVCRHGLIDTAAIAAKFDKLYYGRPLPHKFKIGITGCHNNCLKAEENDLGVKGAFSPAWDEKNCAFCGLCEKACTHSALKVSKDEQKILFDAENCKYCGKCAKNCPTGACFGKSGFIVSFGGMFGNRIAKGENLMPVIFSTEELHQAVEITLNFFAENAKPGERFRNTLDRIGWEPFKQKFK